MHPMTPQKPLELQPLDIITQEAQNVALRFGVQCASDLAASLVARIVIRLSGNTIYIPTAAAQNAKYRQTEIRQKFTGNNHRELAREYGLSTRQIRNIAASNIK
jgi:Mor family transcriptional regulator